MRALPCLAVNAQFHRQVVRIRNLVGGHNPRPQRAERVDPLAETEDARFHFASLNVARRNVIENYIPADIAGRLFRRKVFTGFLQNDRQFQLVIQFLSQVLRIDHRLIVSDDRVGVLKKDNPWHHRMREPGFRRLFVVLPKIARRVKKLLRDDGRLQLDIRERIEHCLSARTGDARALCSEMGHVVESFMCSIKTGVPSAE